MNGQWRLGRIIATSMVTALFAVVVITDRGLIADLIWVNASMICDYFEITNWSMLVAITEFVILSVWVAKLAWNGTSLLHNLHARHIDSS